MYGDVGTGIGVVRATSRWLEKDTSKEEERRRRAIEIVLMSDVQSNTSRNVLSRGKARRSGGPFPPANVDDKDSWPPLPWYAAHRSPA